MMRLTILVFLLVSCRRQPAKLEAEFPTVRRGESISVRARWPGRGEVVFSSTRGVVLPERTAVDDNGASTARFECRDTDAGPCVGDVRIAARLEASVVTTIVTVLEPERDSEPGTVTPELSQRVVRERRDAGPAVFSMGGGKWWHWDGGLFDPVPDEATDFDCNWDGGAHPGFTFPDGTPQATGCDGEPIDVVLFASRGDETVDLCGTLSLSRPLDQPVYPRATYTLMSAARLDAETCCDRFYCLRDPRQIRYRIRLPVAWRSKFELGARTRHFRESLFSPAPFTLEAGPTAGAVLRLPTFEAKPGFRDGDPRPDLR